MAAKIWTAAELAENDKRIAEDRQRVLATRQPISYLSIEEAKVKYGPTHVDGLIGRLIEDGFCQVGSNLGSSGWWVGADGPPYPDMPDRHYVCPDRLKGRVIFVDGWGGGWAQPLVDELSAKEAKEHGQRIGAVSQAKVASLVGLGG